MLTAPAKCDTHAAKAVCTQHTSNPLCRQVRLVAANLHSLQEGHLAGRQIACQNYAEADTHSPADTRFLQVNRRTCHNW